MADYDEKQSSRLKEKMTEARGGEVRREGTASDSVSFKKKRVDWLTMT